jgi:hypothetical protein
LCFSLWFLYGFSTLFERLRRQLRLVYDIANSAQYIYMYCSQISFLKLLYFFLICIKYFFMFYMRKLCKDIKGSKSNSIYIKKFLWKSDLSNKVQDHFTYWPYYRKLTKMQIIVLDIPGQTSSSSLLDQAGVLTVYLSLWLSWNKPDPTELLLQLDSFSHFANAHYSPFIGRVGKSASSWLANKLAPSSYSLGWLATKLATKV